MKLIVGLGNPGPKYERTRHNVGFLAVDRLAQKWGVSFERKRFEAEAAEMKRGPEPLLLLKPQTFMNLSGRSVGSAATFYKLLPADVLVIHDELDLPFGRIRFKLGGGHGGHNGLRDITRQIGEGYLRLRLGIGRPEGNLDPVDYVLAPYGKEDQPVLAAQLDNAVKGLEMWLEKGLEPAMQEIHRST